MIDIARVRRRKEKTRGIWGGGSGRRGVGMKIGNTMKELHSSNANKLNMWLKNVLMDLKMLKVKAS
jgi:hypothetical protein